MIILQVDLDKQELYKFNVNKTYSMQGYVFLL